MMTSLSRELDATENVAIAARPVISGIVTIDQVGRPIWRTSTSSPGPTANPNSSGRGSSRARRCQGSRYRPGRCAGCGPNPGTTRRPTSSVRLRGPVRQHVPPHVRRARPGSQRVRGRVHRQVHHRAAAAPWPPRSAAPHPAPPRRCRRSAPPGRPATGGVPDRRPPKFGQCPQVLQAGQAAHLDRQQFGGSELIVRCQSTRRSPPGRRRSPMRTGRLSGPAASSWWRCCRRSGSRATRGAAAGPGSSATSRWAIRARRSGGGSSMLGRKSNARPRFAIAPAEQVARGHPGSTGPAVRR